ncbi:hypothetical protein [Paenibacillus sp. MDMC362]|uniref:hypothetical protein n=1 Tax=Paenibacillus sp. MDMC362 TaxID=2977365 RepID=UPI000DC2810D|nr:hypothetical protein [Paenibacillus sp. MDMC362]RAR40983.1 hypothetical protein DP091_26225 [Paenibacillus sp. MDMC362]
MKRAAGRCNADERDLNSPGSGAGEPCAAKCDQARIELRSLTLLRDGLRENGCAQIICGLAMEGALGPGDSMMIPGA